MCYNTIIINLAKEDINMQGEVLKFNNGLVLEVVKDEFGTAKKEHDDMPNGFRVHIRNANTCEQYDFNYYCGSAYESSDDISAKNIVENLFSDVMNYDCFEDVDDMANEFGYSSVSKAMKIWRMLEKEYDEMVRVCGDFETLRGAYVETL
jgi:hypothetical protein